jgi:alkanesulfonate monooxygenase SsuD/methylene tetrahydromethanopterin reductase-like flavin-dependent oxidoreductase (luciferase family)
LAGKFGVLLPHFGSYASRERLLGAAALAEDYGLDSVWVRDHIVYHPHAHEDQDRTHVDPFYVLSAIAATTRSLTLATSTLIPHRHPIQTALGVGSLDLIAGPDRLLLAFGIGTYDHEFEAVGMGGWNRREVLPEQIDIMRKLWSGETVSHKGKFYEFSDVQIKPVPKAHVPIWYGGMSLAAVRRAVEYCEGWIPGRLPNRDFSRLVQRMQRLADEAEKPLPNTGTLPLVVFGRTVEEAWRRIDVARLADEMRRNKFAEPPSGDFSQPDDFAGAVMAGPVEHVTEQAAETLSHGVEHVVFDFRQTFDQLEENIQLCGEAVVPKLRQLSS